MQRGEIWWASLRAPSGSDPGYRRPVVVVQSNDFNRSRIDTVVCAAVTSNERLAAAPGNVLLPIRGTGLRSVSVVNVSQLVTMNKNALTEKIGKIPPASQDDIDAGLKLVLAL